MATQQLESRVDRFAGLSDRSIPVQLTRIESPDLRNVEFSGRVMERRNGFKRVHTEQFKDASVAFDGRNDFLYIRYQARYQPSDKLFVSFDTKLSKFPASEVTAISRGFGTGASRFLKISYDPTANTNLGGWRLRLRDGANSRDVTVNDGAGSTGAAPVGAYRHIEFVYSGAGTTYNLKVYDENGNVSTSSAITVATGFITDSNPWWIGVDTNGASGTVRGTDYYPGTISEIRMADALSTPNAAGIYGRELYTDPSSTERLSLIGYWKLNDGAGPSFADSYIDGATNYAIAGGQGYEWITNSSLSILGTALKFYGSYDPGALAAPAFFGGFVWWQNALAVATAVGSADPFTTTLGMAARSWCVDCIFVPLMAQGETTVRNGTIFWAGTDATNPHPVGLRVVSNRLQGYYWDGTTLTSPTPPPIDLSTLANTLLHVGIRLQKSGTSDILEVFIKQKVAGGTTPYYWSSSSTIASAINPTAISGDWGIGDKLLSVTSVPPTARGDNLFGIVQNVSIRAQTNVNLASLYPVTFVYPQATFIPISNTPSVVLLAQVPLNDGMGNHPRTVGAFYTFTSLYPDPYDGFLIGEGLVTPAEPPFSQLLMDWRRIDPNGNIKRSALVISGVTLYDVDLDGGTIAARFAGVPKSTGPYVSDQYGTDIYIAGRGGTRPIYYSDNAVKFVGIEAPQTIPIITSNTAAGSIPAGTYTLYVTYRNQETGNESNPSPAGSFTLASAGQVTVVAIPISADTQVNQRRIWITAAGGGTAYLQATVYDNNSTSYSTAIQTIAVLTSLALTGHQEAPIGSLVAVWKDRLWVAGNNLLPTRVYFSAPGDLSAFNHTAQTADGGAGFLDADLDTGDVCVALKPMINQLVAYFRDGVVEITATGDDTDPFFMTFRSKQSGAVGPLGVIPYESAHFVAGERDFFLFDGINPNNISSPLDLTRPSIQQFVRNGLEPSRRKDISLAIHRAKNQLYAACSTDDTTRNDTVLCYDFSQGIWSRYTMDMDSLLEIEDDTDEPWIYGTSRGHVVKLDTGAFDGYGDTDVYTTLGGAVASGTTSSLTVAGTPWTADRYKGLYVYFWDVSAAVLRSARIARNTTSVLYFSAVTGAAPASGDPFIIGGIPWYADFIADFGNPMQNKRALWFIAKGESDAANTFRLSLQGDVDGRTWAYNAVEYIQSWSSTEKFIRIPIGGVARSFRMRIGDTGYSAVSGNYAVPSAVGKISIFEFSLIVDRLEAH